MSDWDDGIVSDEYASDEDGDYIAAETTDDDDAVVYDPNRPGNSERCQSADMTAASSQQQSPVANAQELLRRHATCTDRNALLINQHLQHQLKAMRSRLEALLLQCRSKYAANERLLGQRQQQAAATTSATAAARRRDTRQTSVLFYGAPFFKTVDCYSAPYNGDYLRRRRAGELFPIELSPRITHWNTLDKLRLINGVREQVVAALQRQHKDWLRGLCVAVEGHNGSGEEALKRDRLLESFTKSLAPRKLIDLMRMLQQKVGASESQDVIRIDWYTVAQKHLHDRHKTHECQAIWDGYMRPTLNRSAWSPEEEDRLMVAVVAHDLQNWPAIASQMDRRSSYQCLVHFRTKLFDHTSRCGRWSPAEDAQLLRVVQQVRIGSSIPWDAVRNGCPGRSSSQCYYRYMFTLRPDIRHDKFTVEEDCILMAAYNQHGLAIEKYMHMLPGRTRVQIRNRWINVLRYENQQAQWVWTQEMDGRLLELVQELGEKNWTEVTKRLGSHTRTSTRSRYIRIQKFLRANPTATWQQMTRRTVYRATTVTPSNWMDTLIQLKQQEQQKQLESADQPDWHRELCNYLRYAYHLRLRPLVQPMALTTECTQAVCRVLHTQVCPVDYKLLHATANDTINMRYLDALDGELSARPLADGETVVLPASWCTALLLRGLAVMFPEVSVVARSEDAEGEKGVGSCGKSNSTVALLHRPPVESADALALFRLRLRALLLNAAVMSRVSMAMPELAKEPVSPQPVMKVEQMQSAPVTCKSEFREMNSDREASSDREEGCFMMETESMGAVTVSVTSRSRRGMKRKLTEEEL